MNNCVVDNCENNSYVKGYCSKHYQQLRNKGKIANRTKYDRNNIIINDDHAEIELYNKGGECIAKAKIDIEDVDKVKNFKWHIGARGYVICRKINTSLHRYLLSSGFHDVDHKNRDKLDNRKSNLRECSHADNGKNKDDVIISKSAIKGVNYHKSSDSWFAVITSDNIRYYSKYYKNIDDASYCRDIMELYLHKEFSARYDYLKEKYGDINHDTFEKVFTRKVKKTK